MVKLLARRLLGAVVVLWGSLSLLFVLFFIVPGDRVDRIIAGDRTVSAAERARTAHHLGLDQSAWVQYTRYWDHLLHGDLGASFVSGRAVSSILHQTVPASLRLAFWALLIEIIAGIGWGIWSAASKSRSVRAFTTGWTALLMALPAFALGYILQLALGVFPFQHGWPAWARFPVQGIGPDSWVLGVIPTGGQWRYLLLPALTLAAVSTAIASRLMRTTLHATMRRDYIRGALAKGLSDRSVLWRHGVRNALIPVITFIGLDLANIFGSAVVTERVFNWPGVGSQIADAISREDAPVILGLTIVLGIVYVVANFIVDVAYAWLDPRVREQQS